jgi:hypothetical protein
VVYVMSRWWWWWCERSWVDRIAPGSADEEQKATRRNESQAATV